VSWCSRRGTGNNYGLYLLDAFGSKVLLYRDPAISCLSPRPLRPRDVPPVVPAGTLVGKPGAPPHGESPGRVVNSCLLPIYTLEKKAMQEVPAWPSELCYAGVLFCGHQPYDRRIHGPHPPPMPVPRLRAGAD
jgi:hypothetical protein